jgi:hypothetical protein
VVPGVAVHERDLGRPERGVFGDPEAEDVGVEVAGLLVGLCTAHQHRVPEAEFAVRPGDEARCPQRGEVVVERRTDEEFHPISGWVLDDLEPAYATCLQLCVRPGAHGNSRALQLGNRIREIC